MKRYFIPLLLLCLALILVVYNYLPFTSVQNEETQIQQQGHEELEMMEDGVSEDEEQVTLTAQSAVLEDVSGGSATGTATSDYVAGTYVLSAQFEDLPPLTDGYFYEGWVVRQGENQSVISTGKTTEVDSDSQINIFESNKDLRDHTFYVLTLEPDDGDPAPAEHILEGYFE